LDCGHTIKELQAIVKKAKPWKPTTSGMKKPKGRKTAEPKSAQEGPPESSSQNSEIEPWPTRVAGPKLINEIEGFITKYIALPPGVALIVVAWLLASWSFLVWDRFPHLAVWSPTKRCGKTRFLTVLRLVSRNPLLAANLSPAVLYRVVARRRPTLLVDEAQNLIRRNSESAEALRELLLAGIDRDASVLRCGGPNYEQILDFSIYSPKVIALIDKLDDVLADRCIAVRMDRRQPGDAIAQFRSRTAELDGRELARKVLRWANDNEEKLAGTYDQLAPFPLQNDRMAELLLPLQAILTIAAPKRLSELEVFASETDEADMENEAPGIKLLAALRVAFGSINQSFIPTKVLTKWMATNDFGTYTGKRMAGLLGPFGVHPRHNKGRTERGYNRDDLEAPWGRYLHTPDSSVQVSKASKSPAKRPTRRKRQTRQK
jgi:Protein of unknown function (DUF3631)